MKKALVLIVLLIPAFIWAADFETDKGAIELGGEAYFTSIGGDIAGDDNITMLGFGPYGHYFVIPNLGIGGVLSFESMSQGDYKFSEFQVGPSLQYYFTSGEGTLFPFVGASFTYDSQKTDLGIEGMDATTVNATTIEFTGGAFFKLVDHFGIKARIYYDIDSQKGDWEGAESVSGNKFGVKFGFTGFVY